PWRRSRKNLLNWDFPCANLMNEVGEQDETQEAGEENRSPEGTAPQPGNELGAPRQDRDYRSEGEEHKTPSRQNGDIREEGRSRCPEAGSCVLTGSRCCEKAL